MLYWDTSIKILRFSHLKPKIIYLNVLTFSVESSTLYDMYFTEYEISLMPEGDQVGVAMSLLFGQFLSSHVMPVRSLMA